MKCRGGVSLRHGRDVTRLTGPRAQTIDRNHVNQASTASPPCSNLRPRELGRSNLAAWTPGWGRVSDETCADWLGKNVGLK